jgi:cyclase
MRRYPITLAAFLMFSTVAVADPFPEVKVQKINDRVYALLGPIDVPNKENGGYMNNSLAIIGNKGVILVDSGSHRAVGEHIGKALAQVTSKPVTHILVTHHHGDHHLGSIAFPDAQVIASSNCAKEIADNGRGMVAFMSRNTGLSLGDTKPVTPQKTVTSESRQAMEIDGIKLELIAPQTAHTHGDLMVWLPGDGILATGDILVHAINPSFRDGNLKNWIGVVDDILKMPLKTVMPGHGALMRHQDVADFRTLIASFYSVVEDIYKSGGAESDVRKKLDLPKWQKLARYDDMMGGNISQVWLEVEAENF